MEELIRETVAYKIVQGDVLSGRVSHAYMLHFPDSFNLRAALKFFAAAIMGAKPGSREERLILSEGFSDVKVYPAEGQKLTVAQASEIVADAAIMPIEGDKKLYIISDFDSSAALFQNKLLKVLEEPPAGVHFLLGATSLAPVMDTIRSRVRLLEIPPFPSERIYAALNRHKPDPRNGEISRACGGILGVAQNMLSGDWFEEVHSAATEIVAAGDVKSAVKVAVKYGDTKYKAELLSEMARLYSEQLKTRALGGDTPLSAGALVVAAEGIDGAFKALKFNANFGALLYDFALKVATENQRWSKLQA